MQIISKNVCWAIFNLNKSQRNVFGMFFTVNLNRPLNWKSMWGWYKASFWAEFWDFFWFHRVENNFKLVCNNWSKINFRCLQKSKFYFFILNVEVFAISSSSTIENGDVGKAHAQRELPIWDVENSLFNIVRNRNRNHLFRPFRRHIWNCASVRNIFKIWGCGTRLPPILWKCFLQTQNLILFLIILS